MFCPNCGNQVPDGQAFCSNCGTKMQAPVAPQQPVQQPTYAQPVQQPVQQPIQQSTYAEPVQQPVYAQPVQQVAPVAQADVHENFFAGLFGAVLFGLIGGAIFCAVSATGWIAGFCGLVIVLLANFGYNKFSGSKGSVKGVIAVILVAVIIIGIACYFGYGLAIYFDLPEGANISYIDVMELLPDALEDDEVIEEFIEWVAISYGLAAVASIAPIKQALANAKEQKSV